MNSKLYSGLQDLIRKECANYSASDKVCMALDKVCPMMNLKMTAEGEPRYKMCSWAVNAVFPQNDVLLYDYLNSSGKDLSAAKECSICGNMFIPIDGRVGNCCNCRKMSDKQRNATIRSKKSGKNRRA